MYMYMHVYISNHISYNCDVLSHIVSSFLKLQASIHLCVCITITLHINSNGICFLLSFYAFTPSASRQPSELNGK